MKKRDAIQILDALAQETRLDAFRLLMEAGPEGLSAGTIAARLDCPAATLSFHLKAMQHAGLVSSRRVSQSIIYRAEFVRMARLMNYLTDNCCSGHPELCGPWINGVRADTSRKQRRSSGAR
ncbi:MAG: metalloregulator ArsR/SmtB family transcription factor [Gammaproteobacteria bacterium]|nr:metalloregulator ArsR/SmtB family transcription factor [Gammaproteobacteria bacterium]